MKRKLLIVISIVFLISLATGAGFVIAGMFAGTPDLSKGLVGHWKMDEDSRRAR